MPRFVTASRVFIRRGGKRRGTKSEPRARRGAARLAKCDLPPFLSNHQPNLGIPSCKIELSIATQGIPITTCDEPFLSFKASRVYILSESHAHQAKSSSSSQSRSRESSKAVPRQDVV